MVGCARSGVFAWGRCAFWFPDRTLQSVSVCVWLPDCTRPLTHADMLRVVKSGQEQLTHGQALHLRGPRCRLEKGGTAVSSIGDLSVRTVTR